METRIIVVPRETFTETKMGTIVMREEVDRLGGFREAKITGFGKGEVAKGIYGLITFIGATETLYNNIISMLLVNDSDATIAQKHTTYPTWIMPGSIIRMIPLHDLPDRGPSLPPEESPATPIWAKIVNTIVEVGRTLWNLFVAGVSFIAELLEKVVEWGLELLEKIMDYIEQVAKMFTFIPKIIAEIVGYFFKMILAGLKVVISKIIEVEDVTGGFSVEYTISSIDLCVCVVVKYLYDNLLGLEIPHLSLGICIDLGFEEQSLPYLCFDISLSAFFQLKFDFEVQGNLAIYSDIVKSCLQTRYIKIENKQSSDEILGMEAFACFIDTLVTLLLAEYSWHASMLPLAIAANLAGQYSYLVHLIYISTTISFVFTVLNIIYKMMTSNDKGRCLGYLDALIITLSFALLFDEYYLATMESINERNKLGMELQKLNQKLVDEWKSRYRTTIIVAIGMLIGSTIMGYMLSMWLDIPLEEALISMTSWLTGKFVTRIFKAISVSWNEKILQGLFTWENGKVFGWIKKYLSWASLINFVLLIATVGAFIWSVASSQSNQ